MHAHEKAMGQLQLLVEISLDESNRTSGSRRVGLDDQIARVLHATLESLPAWGLPFNGTTHACRLLPSWPSALALPLNGRCALITLHVFSEVPLPRSRLVCLQNGGRAFDLPLEVPASSAGETQVHVELGRQQLAALKTGCAKLALLALEDSAAGPAHVPLCCAPLLVVPRECAAEIQEWWNRKTHAVKDTDPKAAHDPRTEWFARLYPLLSDLGAVVQARDRQPFAVQKRSLQLALSCKWFQTAELLMRQMAGMGVRFTGDVGSRPLSADELRSMVKVASSAHRPAAQSTALKSDLRDTRASAWDTARPSGSAGRAPEAVSRDQHRASGFGQWYAQEQSQYDLLAVILFALLYTSLALRVWRQPLQGCGDRHWSLVPAALGCTPVTLRLLAPRLFLLHRDVFYCVTKICQVVFFAVQHVYCDPFSQSPSVLTRMGMSVIFNVLLIPLLFRLRLRTAVVLAVTQFPPLAWSNTISSQSALVGCLCALTGVVGFPLASAVFEARSLRAYRAALLQEKRALEAKAE